MCTVTIVPRGDGFRLVCNRDERRDRDAALPPVVHALGGIQAIFPSDPHGGGTWVGVNTAGLVAALLNRTDERPRARFAAAARFSRGMIVPSLLGCHSLSAAIRAARRVNAGAFAPFRLLVADANACAVVSSNSASLSVSAHSFDKPLMFTSSSLGDEVVAGPRRMLFEQLVRSSRGEDDWLEGQRRFHHHRWHDRPHLGVLMSRADARTVSRTTVDVSPAFVTLRYQPIEDGAAPRVIAVGRAA